ncbi:type I-E CRISPR-associated protein Cas7/Cse4/CasC [Galbitalea sp. SE-J8]|uniref:type I-E CRISPR-associated protein Cas7/Cse4/CasC n=1 Tax=Galbitalea sp. SE-J8 TaxID=3054952 RepID=UPI00259D2B88|nr:type I-E CRISPR-associated protein Cas7/Cse4/CasC [Galbitalea sp. SE-J8]MDM4762832.1 type I-E CRISPR-associated protein Cas7/Cse4/CasC [Galbitalea sp. SE-J8]
MSPTFIDLHVLQTVPPSNINRDDTGSPKSAVYGGVTRARISSQAQKKAARDAFPKLIDASKLGVRTKRVVELVAAEIERQRPALSESAAELAWAVLDAAGIKLTKPKKGEDQLSESGYLLFLSRAQVARLATLAIESDGAIDKKTAKAAADTAHSVDVALFGRMVADATDLSVDATVQVAHAISVHAVENEFDYFTAVDDLKGDDEDAGAAMIGTVEFNSSTLYRYATINATALRSTLDPDDAAPTVEAVRAFIRAFVTSMPTGKQNTFANRTLPDVVVALVRSDQPVNFSGAFEEAVTATSARGRLAEASARLADYAAEISRAYGPGATSSFVVRVGEATGGVSAIGEEVTFDELVQRVGDHVAGV